MVWLFVELFFFVFGGIICSPATLVPPLKSKPLRGMKWVAEWIDVHPFPLVHIHLTYRKTEWDDYKTSVSGRHPPKDQTRFLSAFFFTQSVGPTPSIQTKKNEESKW